MRDSVAAHSLEASVAVTVAVRADECSARSSPKKSPRCSRATSVPVRRVCGDERRRVGHGWVARTGVVR